jgi:hypothetical protein
MNHKVLLVLCVIAIATDCDGKSTAAGVRGAMVVILK